MDVEASSTSDSINFVCSIQKPEETEAQGCAAVVISLNNNQLILRVNNSHDHSDSGTDFTMEVTVPAEGEYYYVVLPITSDGIIGSSVNAGSIQVSTTQSKLILRCMYDNIIVQ